jgi:hypothetical protein
VLWATAPTPPSPPPYDGEQAYGFTIHVEVIPDRRDRYHPRKPEAWWANLTADTSLNIDASAVVHSSLHFNVIVSYAVPRLEPHPGTKPPTNS